jgi:hypothetical protein
MNRLKQILQGGKKLGLYFLFSGIMIFMAIYLSGKLIATYNNAMLIENHVQEMNNYLADWKNKTSYLNSEKYRPIEPKQVDNVQSDLLLSLRINNLELKNLRVIALTQPSQDEAKKPVINDGKAFEINFSGNYKESMNFLENVHSKDALVSILFVRMEAEHDKVNTNMIYKVYTKGGKENEAAAAKDKEQK